VRQIDRGQEVIGANAPVDPQDYQEYSIDREIFYRWLRNEKAHELYAETIARRIDPERGPVYDSWWSHTMEVCQANWELHQRQIVWSLTSAEVQELEDEFVEWYQND